MRKQWIISLALIMMLFCVYAGAFAQEDEEVSIVIYDQNGNAITGENAMVDEDGDGQPDETPVPEPTKDPAAPVYQADGSILLTMSFTGDVTIGSNIQYSGASIFEKELKKQNGNIDFPFRNVKEIFDADDLTMVNFEGTLTISNEKNPKKADYSYLFRADPSYVSMLPDNGIDTVSFENNHANDLGEQGLKDTKETLLSAGITYASEDEPALMTVKGVKIGSLAYQTFDGHYDVIYEKMPQDIAALRQQGCEVVIVSYHWGDEEDYAPNNNQVKLGRATVDAGADLVVGHHSHRINPIEYYNGKYICYSLGNFSFAGNNKPKDMSTYIFQIQMRVKDGEASSEQFRIIPCRISSRTDYNDFTPTPYTKDTNVEAVLRVLKENGKKLEYVVEEYPLNWLGEE
ncbi:MAG: CapA family protein [Eubacteriales bacterium]|nr:CapA family protein [Eubacteriales bacterium]